jgi:hypothetical protein
MTAGSATTFGRVRVPVLPALVTLGLFGWGAFAVLTAMSYAHVPPSAAFDLELLLHGGRLVASGQSPYDPGLLAGHPVEIATLFYSYPPVVAQITSFVASVPSGAVFAAWIAASAALLAAVAGAIRNRFAPSVPMAVPIVGAVALAPLWFPYTVGALFGNLDVFFPALYGVMLLAAAGRGRSDSKRLAVLGGLALMLASITKLHPALLVVWFAVRGLRSARASGRVTLRDLPKPWIVVLTAVASGLVILGLSLAAGGLQPWIDHAAMLRASTNVDLLDPRNLGPAAQIVMTVGLGSGAVGPLQTGVLAIAVVVTALAALRVDDPLESFAWASFASFVPLPVTWFHHFGALLPIGLAAALRSASAGRRAMRLTLGLIALGFLVGIFGLGMPFAWLLLPVTVAAIRTSRPSTADDPAAIR